MKSQLFPGKMPPFFLLLLLLSASIVDIASSSSNPHQGKLIFVLSGQSNMSGRGGVHVDAATNLTFWDHVVPPESTPCPSILRLNANLHWETAAEPLHADIDTNKTCGVGPGLPFAHAVLPALPAGIVLGLVPCAIGGTRITQWARGEDLYNNMVARAKAAVGDGGPAGERRNRVGAVLWYQGESDTEAREDAEAYGGRMERLVHDLRVDLQEPELLVIQVALASGSGNYTDIVRKAQLGIKLPNVLTVDALGLHLLPDQLHLSTEAQVQLGKMLATAYLNHDERSAR